MSDPNPQTDVRPDPESESGPRDRPALLAATPDVEALSDWLRTLAALAGLLGLLLTLIAVELLVRI
ncbi:hypothetical protein C470_08291 [Halorubrum distributum JCM 13561]|uniref:Uncharacterized protein n=1 Tax=Halorubrum distributum JCM 13561 TaxID=1227483 RepID=M0NTI1_9EURY|nr:hypothetical protein [Halorubrum litoreum]EMA61056.1 hypothetical protein C470_08291 [Halorubrum litoreum JCM 13561]